MPKSITALTIFISGTSETDAEKGALGSVINELSEILEKTHGITLRSVVWPDSIRPGAGRDPQDVINQQVGSDYDIYVGILGARFGQPTNRAESGTEEEFNSALRRFQVDPTSVRVMFYFKNAVQDPFHIDIEQLSKVIRFRQSVGPKGILYRDFTDTQSFAELARKNLHNLVVDEWDTTRWRPGSPVAESHQSQGPVSQELVLEYASQSNPEVLEDLTNYDEGLGLIESMEDMENAVTSLGAVLARITQHTEALTKNFEARTSEANAISELVEKGSHSASIGRPEIVRLTRDTADQMAADLEEFAIQMSADVQVFDKASSHFFQCFDAVRSIRKDFTVPVEQIEDERQSLHGFVENIANSQSSTVNFQAIVAGLPALTSKIRKARRRAALALGELTAELQKSQRRGLELLDSFSV